MAVSRVWVPGKELCTLWDGVQWLCHPQHPPRGLYPHALINLGLTFWEPTSSQSLSTPGLLAK